jgi:type IV secretion system protein TrbL
MSKIGRSVSVVRPALLVIGAALGLPALAHAQAMPPGGDIWTVFGQIQNAANGWIPIIMSAATRLFFLLATLDFAWSVPTLLREHDFMGLFQGVIRRLLVIGIFYGILLQGQNWIPAIVQSFVQIGSNATGLPAQMNPTDIMAHGLQICSDLLTKSQNANLLAQLGGVIGTWFLVIVVFISYGIITLHYVVTKLEAIIVMTAGYLFLGFAGSRWTLPYFERYIALAISTGARLMLIYLMLGVFQTVSGQWESTISAWDPSQPIGPMFSEVAAMLLFAFAAWMIPKMAGSLASGSLGLGASDLLAVGGTAAVGAATAVAAVAAPFTGGTSLAAEAGMMGLEGSTFAEGATSMAGTSESAASIAGMGAGAMAGSAGVPANVPAPPPGAALDVIPPPTPPTTPDATARENTALLPHMNSTTPGLTSVGSELEGYMPGSAGGNKRLVGGDGKYPALSSTTYPGYGLQALHTGGVGDQIPIDSWSVDPATGTVEMSGHDESGRMHIGNRPYEEMFPHRMDLVKNDNWQPSPGVQLPSDIAGSPTPSPVSAVSSESDSLTYAESAFERLTTGKPLQSGPVSDALAAAYERGEIKTPADIRGVMESFYKGEDKRAEPVTAAATVISDAETRQTRADDSSSATRSRAAAAGANQDGEEIDTGERRKFPDIPDDGSDHIPPPQLRVDREE